MLNFLHKMYDLSLTYKHNTLSYNCCRDEISDRITCIALLQAFL